MSCQGNENCPYNGDDSNKRLDERLDALEAKLNAMQGDQNNKRPDLKAVSPQVTGPDPKKDESKGESKSMWSWVNAITDIINNLTKLVPTILSKFRGFPGLFVYGKQVVAGISAILLAIVIIKEPTNYKGHNMLFIIVESCIVASLIGYLVWVFRDPDRPGGGNIGGLDSGKKSKKQQNSDNKIDNSENDDDMKDSLKVFERILVTAGTGSGKSTTFYQRLTREQNEEHPFEKIYLIRHTEYVEKEKLFWEYLEQRMEFLAEFVSSGKYDLPILYLKEYPGLKRMYIEKTFSEIIQKDFLFSLSQEKHKVDRMINSKNIDIFNELDRDENMISFIINLTGRILYNPRVNELKYNLLETNTDKVLISLNNYRSSSEFNRVFELYSQHLRMFADQMTSESDLKISKGRKIDINYAIDDSSQLYKEKKNIYPTITHNYLFQIPEIKRLSPNLIVTKESNILSHKFSFALQANTNQCSTEDEQTQISITNNQKTKSNKLLRKKIKLNLN